MTQSLINMLNEMLDEPPQFWGQERVLTWDHSEWLTSEGLGDRTTLSVKQREMIFTIKE
jgi:hypothetical protein